MRLLYLSLLLLNLCVLEGFRWNSCLIRPSIRLTIRTSSTELSMSSKALKLAQEKYSWRGELAIMADEETDLHAEEVMERLIQEMEEPPRVGEQITGHVINVDDSGALLSIRGKMPGYIPVAEASLIPLRRMPESLAVGDTITAEMIGTLRGMPVLSLRNAQLIDAWGRVADARDNDELFTVQVLEVNRGGAVCSAFGGLKAFLPGSHFLGSVDSSVIGRNVTVKLLEALEDEGKLVVSQRLAAAASAPTLQRGTLVSATVTGLRPYGVFLEVEGGHSGLLHISQISSDRVEDVAVHFSLGEALKVMVLSHDKAAGRVALSTRALEANAGDMLRDKTMVFSSAEETLARFLKKEDEVRREREEAAKELAAGLMLDSEGRLQSSDDTASAPTVAGTGATNTTSTRIKSSVTTPSPLQEELAQKHPGGDVAAPLEKKGDSEGAAPVVPKSRGRGRPRSVSTTTTRATLAKNRSTNAGDFGNETVDVGDAAVSALTEAAAGVTASVGTRKPRANKPKASTTIASSTARVTADIMNVPVVVSGTTASSDKPQQQTKLSAGRKPKKSVCETPTVATDSTEKETSAVSSSSSGSLSDSIDSILASIVADADNLR